MSATDQRKERGKTQQLYLVERVNDQTYVIMGSTGNIYTVTINNTPQCNCLDYKNRLRRCKHIYFVLLRIMKVAPGREDKKEYTDDEIAVMIQNIPNITRNLIANKKVAEEYAKLSNTTGSTIKMKDIDGDCPICLDPLDNGELIDFCKTTCGNPIHKECFEMWSKRSGKKTCLFCMKDWTQQISESSYINLAKLHKKDLILDNFDFGDFDLDDIC